MPNSPFLSDVPARHYLREWRELRGMSQEQLGKLCSTTGATISRYEKGDRGLPLELQLRLFETLDILPGQFFAPPEATDLNADAVDLPAKGRRALVETMAIIKALNSEEKTVLLRAVHQTAASFAKNLRPEKLSTESSQSTPDETV